MKQNAIRLILATLLCLQPACVHVAQENETHELHAQPKSQLVPLNAQGVELNYAIYRTSQLPLGDFFTRLKQGEYKKAFRQADFHYRSANFNDKALNKLIESGFIPVYVKLKNTGTTPLTLDEKSFALTNEKEPKAAFYSDQLPQVFSEINPTAVAANVYNTGVVVVGFAAVMAILVVAKSTSFPTNTGSGLSTGGNDPVYNDVHKYMRVNYKDYLIKKTTLQPGEEAKGLLFFYLGETDLLPDSQLVLNANPATP